MLMIKCGRTEIFHLKLFGAIGGATIRRVSYIRGLRPVGMRGKPVLLRDAAEQWKARPASFSTGLGGGSKYGGIASKRTGFALLGEHKASTTRRKLGNHRNAGIIGRI